SPSKVHARGIIAITSSLIEYLLAKLLSFQGFIVLFGVGSLSKEPKARANCYYSRASSCRLRCPVPPDWLF
ncbi:hypothetical protein J7T86_06470, partial [Lactobacillus delbrueckii subsp. lactis]